MKSAAPDSDLRADAQVPDEVLLLHAMMLTCYIDGTMDPAELAHIDSYAQSLPEFRGKDFSTLFAHAKKVAAGHPSVDSAVAILCAIRSPATRAKAYVCAVELTLASGSVERTEELLLGQLQRVLGVDDTLAQKTREVLGLKYSQ